MTPETFNYEEEEEIVNCFPSLEMAQWVQKQAGEQKMTSIIGLEVLDENIIRGNVHGNTVGKVHIAKRLEEQLGKGNYYRYFAFPRGNDRYLVLHKLENIERVFADPTPKPRMAKRIACEPLNGGPVEKRILLPHAGIGRKEGYKGIRGWKDIKPMRHTKPYGWSSL